MTIHDPSGPCQGRRRLLGLAVWAAVAPAFGLTACGDRPGDAQATAPLEIGAGTVCALDGMLLADYPGPKAQIHHSGVAAPVFLCDTVELFHELLLPEQVRKVAAVYVQDMGKADWESPHGHWIDARTALFVHGSRRTGSMGPTIASFALEPDARKFVGEYGGTVLRFAEITPAMVDLSGGAKTDTRM